LGLDWGCAFSDRFVQPLRLVFDVGHQYLQNATLMGVVSESDLKTKWVGSMQSKFIIDADTAGLLD
jgi:hypothetical protein